MSFSKSLRGLIADFDEHNQLWRVLLQAIHDHGGQTPHINALLTDAKGPRLLINAFAKLIVGKIWEYEKTLVDLDMKEGDFSCASEEFLARYEHLQVSPDIGLDEGGTYSETIPKRPCRYRLYHFSRPMSLAEVRGAFQRLGCLEEHAGWRELVAYASLLRTEDLSGCRILAAGSLRSSAVPVIQKSHDEDICVAWQGVDNPVQHRFGHECFYLVRVYPS